jgi:hypothetical protein
MQLKRLRSIDLELNLALTIRGEIERLPRLKVIETDVQPDLSHGLPLRPFMNCTTTV